MDLNTTWRHVETGNVVTVTGISREFIGFTYMNSKGFKIQDSTWRSVFETFYRPQKG